MRKRQLILLALAGLAGAWSSCGQKKQEAMTGKFRLGTIRIISKQQPADAGTELTLMSRFEFEKNAPHAELNNYFQYELGKKIKLVVAADTIGPSLDYFIPLIKDNESEIDSKFIIPPGGMDKPKRIIITDTILDFEKVNILFK
jgi:hypothetical protein